MLEPGTQDVNYISRIIEIKSNRNGPPTGSHVLPARTCGSIPKELQHFPELARVVKACQKESAVIPTTRPPRPRDAGQLAKRVIDVATGQASGDVPEPAGGAIGGRACDAGMTAEERSEQARKAAQTRWKRASSRGVILPETYAVL